MKKLILSLSAVFLFASFTGSKNTRITINKIEINSVPSHTYIEDNRDDFINALFGDPTENNKLQSLKKPRTIL